MRGVLPPTETQHAALAERVRTLAAGSRRTLLGVTGPPGAGKSMLGRQLAEWTGAAARVVGLDGFHLRASRLALVGGSDRTEAIDMFDVGGFMALLRRLREPLEDTVYAPEFRRGIEESVAGAVAIEPDVRLVIVEGRYLLALDEPWNGARELLDEVWYCDADDDVRIANLIARHRGFGKSEDEAWRCAFGRDQRNAELIAATRSRADLIVTLDADPSTAPSSAPAVPRTPLHELSELGQSVWLDHLSRESIHNGALARSIERDAVVGVTSNPTVFEEAIASGDAYAAQVRELVTAGVDDPTSVFRALAEQDARDACDLLAPVWESTVGREGWVSLMVDPVHAFDALATVREARRLRAEVGRPNLMVEIPATPAGLTAVEAAIAAGISVNVTSIFALVTYSNAVEAYVRGVERLVEAGGDPGGVASVVSSCVSRMDAEADWRLDALGAPAELRGRFAIANAKVAYQEFKAIFAGSRWETLAARGASPQRLLWASTSTKAPGYPATWYVDELAGPRSVSAMPETTLRAYRVSGRPEPRIERDLGATHTTFEELVGAGVDYNDLAAALERDGLERFTDSFRRVLQAVDHAMYG